MPITRRRPVVFAFVILAGTIAAAAQPPAAPTLDELRNATYAGVEGLRAPITLTGGRWESAPDHRIVTFAGSLRAAGDLNGNGQEEAAVLLAANSGGGGEQIYLAIVIKAHDKLRNLATTLVGHNVRVRRLAIVDRAVAIDVLQPGAGDAMCCPSELATRRFRLDGTTLREQPATRTGTLTAEAIGDIEWHLHAFSATQATPAERRATLRFEGGRFAGSGGCNRYSAPVTAGTRPGDIAVGAVVSTRRACPGEGMSLETRFFQQLQAVTGFSFLNGDLLLTYGTGAAAGVMRFAPVP